MTSLIRKILLAAIVAFGFAMLANSALAVPPPLVVEFETGPSIPLFSEANFVPGESVTRWISVSNNSGETKKTGVEIINQSSCSVNCLSDKLDLVIKKDGTTLYSGSLTTFYGAGEKVLSDLNTGDTTKYYFSMTFNPIAGNVYQNSNANFDIKIGFFGEESIGQEITPGGGGGGGGGIIIAGLVIFNEQTINIGINEITITWDTSYNSTSRVIYSPQGFPHLLQVNNPPNYGYVFSTDENPDKVINHSVTIYGLNPATTYYYRAVSHASLAISGEQSFTTLMPGGEVAGAATKTGQTGGQTGGRGGFVAAAETGPTESISPTPVAGAAVAGESACSPIPWWPFGYVLLLLILGTAQKMGKRVSAGGIVLWIALLIAALLWWWLEPCGARFWVWPVLILIVFLVSLRFYLKKSSSAAINVLR